MAGHGRCFDYLEINPAKRNIPHFGQTPEGLEAAWKEEVCNGAK